MPNDRSDQAKFLVERGFYPDTQTAYQAIFQMDENVFEVMMNLGADKASDVPFGDNLDLDLD